jgi:hypothetical protein
MRGFLFDSRCNSRRHLHICIHTLNICTCITPIHRLHTTCKQLVHEVPETQEMGATQLVTRLWRRDGWFRNLSFFFVVCIPFLWNVVCISKPSFFFLPIAVFLLLFNVSIYCINLPMFLICRIHMFSLAILSYSILSLSFPVFHFSVIFTTARTITPLLSFQMRFLQLYISIVTLNTSF